MINVIYKLAQKKQYTTVAIKRSYKFVVEPSIKCISRLNIRIEFVKPSSHFFSMSTIV